MAQAPKLKRRLATIATVLAALALPVSASASISLSHDWTAVTEQAGSIDGIVAPGDTIGITESVRSGESSPLTNVTGQLLSNTPGVTPVDSVAGFGTIGPGGTANNDTPYTAEISSGVQCGESLSFGLAMTTAQGTTTVPFDVQTGAAAPPQSHASADVPHDIPDLGTVLSTFHVSQAGRLKDVAVRIGSILHPFDSDLVISIVAPNGTRVVLVNHRGDAGQNFADTVLTADQGPPIAAGTAPFTGTYQADGDLSVLEGVQQEGDWTLEIQDTVQSDVGQLQSWGADLSPATCAPQPLASFVANPSPGTPGAPIAFDGSVSRDPTGTITKYEWDFNNDGIFEVDSGTNPQVAHTFPAHGAYPVTLRVTDNHGQVDTYVHTIPVTQPPTAVLAATPTSPLSKTPVTLSGAGSTDPDGSIVNYEWDLDGNGTFERTTGSTPTTSAEFSTSGVHSVVLRVTDADGATSTATLDLLVQNRPPTAAFSVATPVLAGVAQTLDASTSTDVDGTIEHYEWDLDGNGSFETDGAKAATYQATFTPGTHQVGLRVTDDAGANSTIVTHDLVVTNKPVAAAIATPDPARPGELVSFDASASSDADGPLAKFEWDLDGNGSYETDTATTPAATHVYTTTGTRTVHLRVTDGSGATDVVSFDVHVTNLAPIAALVAAPSPALAGETVQFDASGSSDPDGMIVKYEWDLDANGSFELDSGTSPSASRSYPNPGIIPVRVRVTDNTGATTTKTADLQVLAPSGGGTGGTGGTGGSGGTGSTGGIGSIDPGSADPGTPFGPLSAGLSGAAIQGIKLARTHGLTLVCRADRPARCTLTAAVDARTARKLRMGRRRRVGTAFADVVAGTDAHIVLRLSPRTRKALKKTRRISVLVKGTAVDGRGNTASFARTVLLR